MIEFPHYSNITKISEGEHASIYRARHLETDVQVMIKHPLKKQLSREELLRYQYEYELLKDISNKYIIKVNDFKILGDSCFIVMQEINASTVNTLLDASVLTFKEKLDIALSAANALKSLQTRNIIHKAITLSNMLYNPETKIFKLINFNAAITLLLEQHVFKSPYEHEGNAFYFSPEQTGRMNRSIDYRSDLYALGVCCYKLFTGKFPFEQTNHLELYHAIMATKAKSPCDFDNTVPLVVSNMIMKLLEKNAEDRYQSAHGLACDIKKYQGLLPDNTEDVAFTLAMNDAPGKLNISQKLFGRKEEINALMQAFERVSNGAKEMVLVGGYSGVGKSALVNEMHKPITRQKGFFIEGKFDQFKRDKPYFTLVQAFSTWVEMILVESKPIRASYKARILHALSKNSQVLIDLIPALGKLLGQQEAADQLISVEAQNRFNFLFSALIRVIATKQHPLVIFVDDLQWSDQATLNLIEALMYDTGSAYFLLFGAYRDNEVDDAHPFMQCVTRMRKEDLPISTITINNLKKEDVSQLIQESLHEGEKSVDGLVDLIDGKTHGNAFFVNKFMQTLNKDGLLIFDFKLQRWRWDIEVLHDMQLSDNVVELMSRQIGQFQPTTQASLTYAACIGNRFDLHTLSIISEKNLKESARTLEHALINGLIIAMKEEYKYTAFAKKAENVVYKFAHDRIQQAAYSFLSAEQKPAVHLHIGRLLHEKMSKNALEDTIFDIVNHKNVGASLIVDPSERLEMAQMNFFAAISAQKTVAFSAANAFLNISLLYLGEHPWKSHYQLCYDVHLLRAEISYIIQDFASSDASILEIIQQAKTGQEKARVENISIDRATMEGRYQAALEHGRMALKHIGFTLAKDHYEAELSTNLQQINTYLETHTIASLSTLPLCEDETITVAMQILMNLVAPSYILSNAINSIVCSNLILLSIQHGNSAYSSMAYASWGIFLTGTLEQHHDAYAFGQVAIELGKKFKHMKQICLNNFIVGGFLNNWVYPIEDSGSWADAGYQAGMQSGELQYVGYILYIKLSNAYVSGWNLSDIRESITQSSSFIRKTQNTWCIRSMGAISLAISALKGEPSLDEEKTRFLASVQQDESQHGLCLYHIHQAQVAFIFNHYAQSLKFSEVGRALLPSIRGFLATHDCNFYNSLSIAMLALNKKAQNRKNDIIQITRNQAYLKKISSNVPENFLHKYNLVEAHLAWIKGEIQASRLLFNAALDAALNNKFYQDMALISENYALFLLQHDNHRVATLYFEDALYYYERWMATEKVKQLKYFMQQTLGDTKDVRVDAQDLSLDYSSVIKSVHLLSREIKFSALVTNYVSVSMENAGAQRAVLLIPNQEGLEVILEKSAGKKANFIEKQLNVFNVGDLLIHSLIQRVQELQEPIIIANTPETALYACDPYVLKHKPLSVLALPVIHSRAIEAVLYLENALSSDLFSAKRVEVLSILGAQAAISFENVQLYTRLEHRVQERTKALKSSNTELATALRDLQKTQNQLVEAEKNAALGHLVAGVAHEINTPVGTSLTGITHFASELGKIKALYKSNKMSKVSFDEFLETSQTIAELITKSLQHTAKLVFSFKKIAVSQSEEDINTFRLKEAIEQVMMSLDGELKNKHIVVQLTCDENLIITSYANSIYQIFAHLISNSIVHAFDKQTSGNILIVASEQKNTIQVKFLDDGKGIKKENISKVFDPFFTTQMGQGATGLGLHIIYNIITQLLKGSISVSSSGCNKGTCFELSFIKTIH